MRRQQCPYCKGVVDVLDSDLGKTVQCDKVRCGKFFVAVDDRPVPPSANSSPRRRSKPAIQTVLTGPHRCFVCKGEISRPLHHRRCTILHHPNQREDNRTDNCRMDVYAAIYYCPYCLPGTLLETPSYQWGQPLTCPVCARSFDAPYDDVLHERTGDAREGITISFPCPNCHTVWQCDSTRGGSSITGTRVVCRSCLHVITVPSHGERVCRPAVL